MSDIFATEETQSADEAQAATSVDVQPEAAASAPATQPAARKASVEDSNGKVVVTLKGGKGYEAPWIVLHCDTVAEANGLLSDDGLKELIDRTTKAGQYFAKQGGAAAPAPAAAAPAQTGGGSPYGAPQKPENISDKVWQLIQQGGTLKRGKNPSNPWVGIAPPKGQQGGITFINDYNEKDAVLKYFG